MPRSDAAKGSMRSIEPIAATPVLVRMVVNRLFGQYDYVIPSEGHFSDAAILYGDNGSGKTTLLNLVFHMLSPADNRGHRTAIAGVPFRRFEIELSNGTTLSATRAPEKLSGGYRLQIHQQGEPSASWDYEPGPRTPREETEFELQQHHGQLVPVRRATAGRRLTGELAYLQALKSLNIGVYLLSADRQISSDALQEGKDPRDIRHMFSPSDFSDATNVLERTRAVALHHAVQNAWQWIARQAVVGTNVGSDNTNVIYAEIVRRIARSKRIGAGPKDLRAHKEKVEATLLQIAQSSNEYAKYEFMAPLKAEEMIDGLQRATGKTAQVAMSVLEPYIEGAQARFAALRDIFALTETFVNTLNGFYGDKALHFGLTSGFRIQNSVGVELAPEHLSSGEQQLLLLFCHTLIARDRPSLFIIDEPELSLNVKWQRKLVRALLDVVAHSQIQFLFASHSIELLAQHKEKVVPLRMS